jgi:hypothetical protein
MKRLSNLVLFAALPLLLLLSLSAGATTVARKGTAAKPRMLVSEPGLIRSFAQDAEALAWVGPGYKVHVRSLLIGRSATVGSAAPALPGSGPSPALALAGTRVLWSRFEDGNSQESSLWTSTLGARPTLLDTFAGGVGDPGGLFLTGVAGDGPTLLYGKTFENSPLPWPIGQSLEASGGVVLVTGQYVQPPIGGIPPAAKLAFAAHDPQSTQISQGALAVAPAVSPLLTNLFDAPRVAENGPVQVYRLLNNVVLKCSVAPHGYVKAIALNFRQLALLVQRANGPRLIERYNAQNGAIIGTTPVSSSTAFELSISTSGIVYRVGNRIYLVGENGIPKLVWNARARPIGLSIEGKRVAWAENVKGRGRVVALTVP